MKTNLLIISIFVFSVAISEAQINLSSGLIGDYTFNGNANDASSSANSGTVNGPTLTAGRNGAANEAYSFDGVNDYISLAPAILQISTFSYSVWVKMASNPTSGTAWRVFSIGSLGGDFNISVSDNYSGYTGWTSNVYNSDATNSVTPTNSLTTLNTWHHLVVMRDNSWLKIYLDGNPLDSGSTTGKTPSFGGGTVIAYIGARRNGSDFYNGIIDDMKIYNRVLNYAEIKCLYNGSTCPSTVSVEEMKTEENEFVIFPNPTEGLLKLAFNDSRFFHSAITVYNSAGSRVYRSEVDRAEKGEEEIDLSSLSAGIYMVEVKTEQYSIFRKISIE